MSKPSSDQGQEEEGEIPADKTLNIQDGFELQIAEICPCASTNDSPTLDQVPLLIDMDITPF